MMINDGAAYAAPGSSYAPGGSTYNSQVPRAYAQQSNPWGDLWSSSSAPAPRPGYDGVGMPKVQDPMVAAQGGGSVFDWIIDTFRQYGMEDVGKDALGAIRDARSPEEAIMAIRETDSYKTRFAGNVARLNAGFGALSEGEYLAMESSYRQTLRAAGLPKGFYDDPQDLAGWIGGGVSVAEVGQRAQTAMELVNSRDPNELKAFQQFYGVGKGDLAAYFLDPSKALPLLQKRAAAAELGAEAIDNGIKVGAGFAEKLVDKGVSTEAARGAFGDAALERSTIAKLGAIDGQGVGINDVVEAKLGLDSKAEDKLRKAYGRERSRFGGSSGGTLALKANSSGSF